MQSLIDEAAQAAPKPPTGAQRKAALQQVIDQNDLDKMLELQEKLEQIIDTILANKIDLDHLGMLTPAELYDFMVEYLAEREVKELLEIRYQMLRAAVFAHITAVNAVEKIADPEHTPGEAPVEKLRKKFVRQGGRMKAILDRNELAKQLGEQRWKQICKAHVIPAQPERVEYHLDEEAMVALVQQDPAVMEIFRACVTSGGYGVASLHVKDLG